MKKLLALLLAGLMLLSFAACGDKNGDEENLRDYLQNDEIVDRVTIGTDTFHIEAIDTETVAITGYKGSDVKHALTIPETLDNKSVVEISDEAFKNCTSITSVTFPATIEKIGVYAFAGCLSLETVAIPANVEVVAEGAFTGCTSLKTVTLATDTKMTKIAKNTFNGCVALESFATAGAIKTIEAGAFFGCAALKTVTIAEGVEKLGAQAFQNCKALDTLTVPASLTTFETVKVGIVDEHMIFAGCENLYLDGITVPAGSAAETYFKVTLDLEQSAPAED